MARTSRPTRFPIHGSELRALLAACHMHPDDDTPRLVLADWLQERDDPRGELMRLQVRLAAMGANDPEYDTLFEQHRKWWKRNCKLWEKDVGTLIWDFGPHNRGLPTIGYYDDDYFWFNTDDVQDPAKDLKDRLSATVAEGWPGMTWVLPMAFAEFDDWDGDDYEEEIGEESERGHDPFEPFYELPWAGSPTPIGIAFAEGTAVTPEHIDLVAKVPSLRGLSFCGTVADASLLPRIAKIKHLEHLDLDYVRLNDDGVRQLLPLKNLRTLITHDATFTNKGAALIEQFEELRELRISTRRLTAAGYKSLAKLSKLEVLYLDKADDAAVRHLAPLKRLRVLDLTATNATGRGAEEFPLLTELRLEQAEADDEGLANIAALKRLTFLDVSGTKITGKLLSRLSGSRWLEYLYASGTAIRDKDLVHLEGLKNLETVGLQGTKVSKKAAEKYRERFDWVRVSYY